MRKELKFLLHKFKGKVDVSEMAFDVAVGLEPFATEGTSPYYIVRRAVRNLEFNSVTL
jgi:hypothetical protein